MQQNKILFSMMAIICFASFSYAKNSYYYYNGERIPLVLSDDSVCAYTNQGHMNLESIARTTCDAGITSLEYIVKGVNKQTVKMSNRFYVQLFDSINDMPLLKTVARETNTDILGPIPYLSDWYELVVNNSTINNSLEMSNYFYETGLFKNIDPGFIFNFISSSACVSDNYFSEQWGMDAINACDAWTISKGNSNVKLAIIDYGVQRQHPEFIINQFVDLYDCNTHTTNGYTAYGEHGTQVCGVMVSDHNHANIAGVSPNCKIIPISYYPYDTNVVAADIASGFAWAVNHGADVINCSWGDHNSYAWLHSSLLESSIQNALENGRNGKGCVVVFAAGNQNSIQLDYPGRVFSDIITVGAIKSDNTRWEDTSNGSSYGYDLDIMAPGHNIYTADLDALGNSTYNYYKGTSFAAPHVSGIAGLILSVNPYLTQKEVADIIESTAQKVGPSYIHYETETGRPNGTWNFEMGYGLVDAYAAVNKAKNTQIRGPYSICDTAKYYLIHPSQSGETVSWSVENGDMIGPYYYSIIGDDDQDTVLVKCEYIYSRFGYDSVTVPTLDHRQYLSVTISTNDTSETYTKTLHGASNKNPNISASNSSMLWPINTQRTFTITNCSLIADSLLHWRVQTTFSRPQPITLTGHFYGQTLTYTPQTPPGGKISTIRIFASNEKPSKCGEAYSDTLLFIVPRNTALLTNQFEQDLLNVYITEDSEESSHELLQLDENSNYTLELWHNIYGRMCEQTVHTPNIQMSTSELSQGIYVLILKENGNIVAETKVQIN